MLLLFCSTPAYFFTPDKKLYYVFSARNNCKFLESNGVNLQSVHHSFFKMPAFGASCCLRFYLSATAIKKSSTDIGFKKKIMISCS